MKKKEWPGSSTQHPCSNQRVRPEAWLVAGQGGHPSTSVVDERFDGGFMYKMGTKSQFQSRVLQRHLFQGGKKTQLYTHLFSAIYTGISPHL